MKPIFAANLFENPLVLAAIVLAGMLANWLLKRWGQAGAEVSPNEGQPPLSSGEQGHPARQPTLQDILGRLLRGEPPVMAPSPPPLSRDDQRPSVESDEKLSHSEQMWPDESQTAPRRLLKQRKEAAEQGSALAARVEANVHGVVPFVRQTKHPPRAMHAARRRPSRGGKGAVPLWPDRHSVRRAFVASLIFAPPKGLEA